MPHSRDARPEVVSLIVERWSPRAFDGSPITADERAILLDAARWAASAYNGQPWRFLYAHREDANWQRFLDLLIPFNQGWVQHAGLLLFAVSDRMMAQPDGTLVASRSHSFDCGAAVANLALQAQSMGLAAHSMTGVDFDRATVELGVPEHCHLEAAVAVGRRGDPATLPDFLREREHPSGRRPVAEFAYAGNFPAA
jgi:nitroreductase